MINDQRTMIHQIRNFQFLPPSWVKRGIYPVEIVPTSRDSHFVGFHRVKGGVRKETLFAFHMKIRNFCIIAHIDHPPSFATANFGGTRISCFLSLLSS